MEILNLGGPAEKNNPAPKSRKKLRVILGIGALAAVTGIGSTLAANISLNGGGNVEFGQGVATTAACDSEITLTPISTFSNAEVDATFAMTSIEISGIDLTPEGWDQSAFDGPAWDTHFDYRTHAWDAGFEQFSGKYRNEFGDWINTCENKVLMLRAYTNNYPESTINNNVSSPLLLTGEAYNRPYFQHGTNAGVGFRVTHNTGAVNYNSYFPINEINANGSGSYAAFQPTILSWEKNDVFGANSLVTIFLTGEQFFLPLSTQQVDKITIESAATIPPG